MSAISLVDSIVLILANLANLLMVGIFLLRTFGRERAAKIYLGVPLLVLGIPIASVVLVNLYLGRAWWAVLLPLGLVAFLCVELVLDYLVDLDFRRTWLIGPYLGLYYVGFMMMIGYSFLTEGRAGFLTLATYFLMLGATALYFARGSPSERRPRLPRHIVHEPPGND